MRNKKIRHSLEYYLPILIIFTICLLSIFFISDKKLIVLITFITTFFYFSWGIIHHKLNHDLTNKIVIEYALVASLGMSILFFILKGGIGL